jgi:hypothetical protein
MLNYLHFLFLVFSISLFLTNLRTKYKNLIFILLILVLILTAGLRIPNSDRDYQNYITLFDSAPDINIEPSFILISIFVKSIFGNTPIILFIIFSFVSIGIKYFALKRITELWFISIFLYFSYYFILHDLTQIRAGVAASLLFLLLPTIYNRNPLQFIFISVLAISFHYSAFIFLFLWFFKQGLNNKILYLLIPLGYLFHYFSLDVFLNLPFESINSKLNIYKALQDGDSERRKINVFNFYLLFKIFIYYLLLFKINYLNSINKYSKLIISIYGFSIFLFLFFSKLPIVSFRIYELLGVIEIVSLTFIYYLFSLKIIPLFFYLVVGILYFYLLIYNIQIII